MDQIAICLGGRKVVQEEATDGEMSPQLVATGTSFRLVIEGTAAMNVCEKTKAILMWVLSHSVCHAKFSKHDRVLGIYLQKLVIKFDDGSKVPARALKVYSRLCAQALH